MSDVSDEQADRMQERIDEVGEEIEDVRRTADSNVPGLDLDPEERYTEHEPSFADSGEESRTDEDESVDSKQDDQTIAPPG